MAHIIKRIAKRLDRSVTERDQDVLSFVKQHLTATAQPRHLAPLQISTRNSTCYISAPDEENWKKNYERRREMQHYGLFSPMSRPYVCVGNPVIDNQKLFACCLSDEDQEVLTKQLVRKYGKISPSQERLLLGKQKVEDFPDHRTEICRYNNGYSYIREHLEEMRKIHMAMVSEQPLPECLKELEEKIAVKSLPTEESGLVSGNIVPNSPATELSKSRRQILARIQQTEALDAGELEQLMRIQKRNRQHALEKLTNVYMLLCGILPMRNSDLTTMTPLRPAYVKYLVTDLQKQNKQAILSLPPLVKRRCLLLGPVLEDLNNKVSEFTWDAMFTAPRESRPTLTRTKGLRNPLISGLRKGRASLKEFVLDTRDLPPWLYFLVEQIDYYDELHSTSTDKNVSVAKHRTKFADLQLSLNDQTHQDLADKKRSQTLRMQTLLQSLEPEFGDDLASTLAILTKLIHKKVPVTHPSLWFSILENECLDLAGDLDKEMSDLLENLKCLHKYEIHKLQYAKEKLCLLTISLPAMKLLQPALQESLVFIMENVLKQPSKQLAQWYQYRKLPFVEFE